VSGVDEQNAGLVSGIATTAVQIGGAVGVAILSSVAVTTTMAQPIGTPPAVMLTAGFTQAFAVASVMLAAAVPIALIFLRLRPREEVIGKAPSTSSAPPLVAPPAIGA